MSIAEENTREGMVEDAGLGAELPRLGIRRPVLLVDGRVHDGPRGPDRARRARAALGDLGDRGLLSDARCRGGDRPDVRRRRDAHRPRPRDRPVPRALDAPLRRRPVRRRERRPDRRPAVHGARGHASFVPVSRRRAPTPGCRSPSVPTSRRSAARTISKSWPAGGPKSRRTGRAPRSAPSPTVCASPTRGRTAAPPPSSGRSRRLSSATCGRRC